MDLMILISSRDIELNHGKEHFFTLHTNSLFLMIELLLLAVIPGIVVMWYIYSKDTTEPEPIRLVIRVFLFSAGATLIFGCLPIPDIDPLFDASIVAPVCEELLKFSIVYLLVYRLDEFDEPVDGIIYSTASALGFATMENIFYVFENGIGTGILRAVLSVPGHALDSCFWGFALGVAKFRPSDQQKPIIFAGLCAAMVSHGLFNFLCTAFEVAGSIIIFLVLVPFGWWMIHYAIRTAHADPVSARSLLEAKLLKTRGYSPSPLEASAILPENHEPSPYPGPGSHPTEPEELKEEVSFCTACGAPHTGEAKFCNHCGASVRD